MVGELCFILDIFIIITVHFIFQDVHLTLSKEWAIKGKISHLSYGLVQETSILITKTDKLTWSSLMFTSSESSGESQVQTCISLYCLLM